MGRRQWAPVGLVHEPRHMLSLNTGAGKLRAPKGGGGKRRKSRIASSAVHLPTEDGAFCTTQAGVRAESVVVSEALAEP